MRFPRGAHGAVLTVTLFVAGGCLGGPAWAAPRSVEADRPYWRTNLFKRVATDQRFLLTRWLPHEIRDPQFVCSFGAGLAIAIQSGSREAGAADAVLEHDISTASRSVVTNTAHGLTAVGEAAVVASILGITYLSSRRNHDDRLSAASSLGVEALIDAGIWATILKAATARVRPGNPNANRFFQYGASQNTSFPSGHAMDAFSVAAVFAGVYKDKTWVPWLSYGLATMVSVSRVSLGRHYPGDVIVGGVLGASIGRGVLARDGEETARRQGTIVPVVGPGGRGVGVGWSYSWN
jgi:membrane-associated phospholipid phosphatase